MERYTLEWTAPETFAGDRVLATRFDFRDPELEDSIRRFGVLSPLLAYRHEGALRLISGYRRVEAARSAGIPKMPVLVLADRLSEREAFCLALVSNWRERRTELDGAVFFERARALDFEIAEIQNQLLPLMGYPPERHWIHEFQALAGLSPMLLEDIRAGRLPERGASALARLDRRGQEIFSERAVRRLHLTSSQLMKTAEWLLDMIRLCGEPLEALLAKPDLEDILGEPRLDVRQKTERFFRKLKDLRFPRQAQKEGEFQAAAKSLEKGVPGLKIEAPAHFEEPGFQVHLKARDPAALDRLLDALAEKRSSMRELFKIVL